MRHKEDAIKNANNIIEAHQEIGLSLIDAQKSALITVGFLGRKDSLTTRTQNYLRCLILGEEKTRELMDLETRIQKNYNIIWFDFDEDKCKIASQENSEFNKQILDIQSEWKKK
jgi:hypothetical protein